MTDLTIFPADIAEMSVSQLAQLTPDQKLEVDANLGKAIVWLKQARTKFDAALKQCYEEQAKAALLASGRDFGTAHIREPLNLGDLVKYEEECLNYSRDVETLAAGQNLTLGCILGRDSATGKVKQIDPGAVDGTQIPVGLLMADVDASLIDREDTLVLARHAVVASNAVVWPPEISPIDQVTITKQLISIGILIRQGA